MERRHGRPAVLAVLRDLLLSADEAGSTAIELILDPGVSTDSRGGITRHRKPALLVYSQPITLPLESGIALSKFRELLLASNSWNLNNHGLWTDGPSLVAGQYNVTIDHDPPWPANMMEGGAEDLVHQLTDISEPGAHGHLLAFDALEHDFSSPLPGVAIRIPLQTETEAAATLSSKTVPAVSDAISALDEFKRDIPECLLFTKHMLCITVRIVGKGVLAEARLARGNKFAVVDAFAAISQDHEKESVDATFLVSIDYSDRSKRSEMQWLITHHIRRFLPGEEITPTARAQNAFPWVAIAAPIDRRLDAEFSGKLFRILPLPVATGQPVHIHGGFVAMQNIDASIVLPGMRNDSFNKENQWNKTLSESMVPHAWSGFLQTMALLEADRKNDHPAKALGRREWCYWPSGIDKRHSKDLLAEILSHTLDRIIQNKRSVWPTQEGYRTSKDVFITRSIHEGLQISIQGKHFQCLDRFQRALHQVKMPISYTPDHIFEAVKRLSQGPKILTPSTLYYYLKEHSDVLSLADADAKESLLGYLLSRPVEGGFGHLVGLPLFPMCDGSWKALGYLSVMKLPMDDAEARLFSKQGEHTVACQNLSEKTRRTLRRVVGRVGIQQWTIEDVAPYLRATYFHAISEDRCETYLSQLSPDFPEFLSQLWNWLLMRYPLNIVITSLQDLWLIPLLSGRLRKLSCYDGPDEVVLDPRGSTIGTWLLSISEYFVGCPLYDYTLLSASTTENLKTHGIIRCCTDIGYLLDWLSAASDVIGSLPAKSRKQLCEHIAELAAPLDGAAEIASHMVSSIKRLELFEEIRNTEDGITLNWTALSNPSVIYVAADLEAVPELQGVVFLSNKDRAIAEVLRIFGLALAPDAEELLEYIIPGLTSTATVHTVERLAVHVMKNLQSLSEDTEMVLMRTPFIPVAAKTGKSMIERLTAPTKCVDPESEVGSLYFHHECVWVPDRFLIPYRTILSHLGMVQKITRQMVEERIVAYVHMSASLEAEREDIARKAMHLIEVSTAADIPDSPIIKGTRWLPAKNTSGVLEFLHAEIVRDEGFRPLVGYAMGILPFSVGDHWAEALGWSLDIPAKYIRRQVEVIVEREELQLLLDVLDYVASREGYEEALRDLSWIPGTSGKFFLPADVFFGNYELLRPFCDTIWHPLLKQRHFLETVGVLEHPPFSKLQSILLQLRQMHVEGGNLAGFLDLVVLTVRLYPAEDYASWLFLPDHRGLFVPVSELTASEPKLTDVETTFLHPDITADVIAILKIPTFSQREAAWLRDQGEALREETNIAERLENIKHRLSKYDVRSTFNEFLKFAATLVGATTVEWILDPGDAERAGDNQAEHNRPCSRLFFVADGVLDEKSLARFIELGSGKVHNEAIDDGIITMYFWTGIPQIVTADSYVLFDLEHELFFEARGRPRSITLEATLSKMQNHYPNQLHPFHGVRGFGPDTTRVDGTIVLFQLRAPLSPPEGSLSRFKVGLETARCLLEAYQSEASISLLFPSLITRVQFSLRSEEGTRWSVLRQMSVVQQETTASAIHHVNIRGNRQTDSGETFFVNTWAVAGCLHSTAVALKTGYAQTGYENLSSFRIAAFIGSSAISKSRALTDGRMFGFVPSRWSTSLPVHIQVPHTLSSKGEPSEKDMSTWDSTPIQDAIGMLYLDLLGYLTSYLGETAYFYWPDPDTMQPFGARIAKAVWARIGSSELKLFVATQWRLLAIGGLEYGKLTEQDEIESDFDGRLTFANSTFDLLGNNISRELRSLLMLLRIKHIVRPNDIMIRGLKKVSALPKTITPQLLRQHLKASDGSALLTYWLHGTHDINPVLEFILNEGQEPESLLGCPILPLLSRKLGILGSEELVFINSTNLAPYQLFEYMPDRTLHFSVGRSVTAILTKLNLNVRLMTFTDVPQLFKSVSSEDKDSDSFHSFLERFWTVIHMYFAGRQSYTSGILSQLPIHSAQVGAKRTVLTPEAFDSEPAIVAPERNSPEALICLKLPGLRLVNAGTYLKTSIREESLRAPAGLIRFVKAISKLAFKTHEPLDRFVTRIYNSEDMLVLRESMICVIPSLDLRASSHQPLLNILRQLPVWPSCRGKLVKAADAILLPDRRLFLSTMKAIDGLIAPDVQVTLEAPLRMLSITVPEVSKIVELHVLPRTRGPELAEDEVNEYATFLKVVFELMPTVPREWPLAIDGMRRFRRVEELYNHRHHLFNAAFRGESQYFLHESLQSFFGWSSNGGLRDEVSPYDFIACAKRVQCRIPKLEGLTDQESIEQLHRDALSVYQFLLCAWQNTSYDLSFWQQLSGSNICFVPTKRDFSEFPWFRRVRMGHVAARKMFSSMQNCVVPLHADVCWSQCPLYEISPSTAMLAKIRTKGEPSLDNVLAHLRYLSQSWNSTIDFAEYIKDIVSTYKFLDDHSDGLRRFSLLREERLLCNLDLEEIPSLNKERFRACWVSAKNLCVGILQDYGEYRRVRTLLQAHTNLLSALGVEPVKGIKVNTVVQRPRHPEKKSVVSTIKMLELWQAGKLCDVELTINGNTYRVHRLILASTSEYWEQIFTNTGAGRRVGSFDVKDTLGGAVPAVLRYMYTGKLDPLDKIDSHINNNATHTMNTVLDWLALAHEWKIPALLSDIEALLTQERNPLLGPDNVRLVLRTVKELNAAAAVPKLVLHCEKYIAENRQLVDKIEWEASRNS